MQVVLADALALFHRKLGLDLGPGLVLEAAVAERALEPQDRVELLPLLGCERLAVALRITLVVAAQPVREALEQERPFAAACRGEEPPEVSYKDKAGKYQGQVGVTLPKL